MCKLRFKGAEWHLRHECQSHKFNWGILTTSLLSFPLPTLIKPIHIIPNDLSSMPPPIPSVLSYNLEVKGGAESWGLWEVLLLPQNQTSNQRALILPLAQCQQQMLMPAIYLFPVSFNRKICHSLGKYQDSLFWKLSCKEGTSFNFWS